jgi:hypothetical protein
MVLLERSNEDWEELEEVILVVGRVFAFVD